MRHRLASSTIVLLLVLLTQDSAMPAGASVAVSRVDLDDDGDQDGFADPRETVALRLRLINKSDVDLTGVTARLTTDSPLVCLTQPFVTLEALPAWQELPADGAAMLVVSAVHRSALTDPLSVSFDVTIASDQFAPITLPRAVQLDLDLDVGGGSGATTFLEGFEDGLGSFAPMQLDEELNPPEDDLDNIPLGIANADGHRCQYSDPGIVRLCVVDGVEVPCFTECFPNATGQPDAFYFHVTDDRSFSGSQSVHFGEPLDVSLGFTTPTAQLEAIRATAPINLSWRDVCSESAADCASDVDCPIGESCGPARLELSFWHQISFMDSRAFSSLSAHETVDRAVVQVQTADEAGEPLGDWIQLTPYWNPYDAQHATRYFQCSFDPVDDGNDEDDYFLPGGSGSVYGPSSTCFPEFVFAAQGDTTFRLTDPYHPEICMEGGCPVGRAEGPGSLGYGLGVWVRPVFDLSRFRGRRVRLRFLVSGLKLGSSRTWEEAFALNPDSRDDGWFLDDVTIRGALIDAATTSLDDNDNADLNALPETDSDGVYDTCDNCPFVANDQQDGDRDGWGDACDACPTDAENDLDGDGFCCPEDNCCALSNSAQQDDDDDGVGNVCDNCPFVPNASQADVVHPGGGGDHCEDSDDDGAVDAFDNCPGTHNPDQSDGDLDLAGTACDCDDADPLTLPGIPESNDGKDNQCPGDPGFGLVDEISGMAGFFNAEDREEFSWPAQALATMYQILLSPGPEITGCEAVIWRTSSSVFVVPDGTEPEVGETLYFLVRALEPNRGSAGIGAHGSERTLPCLDGP